MVAALKGSTPSTVAALVGAGSGSALAASAAGAAEQPPTAAGDKPSSRPDGVKGRGKGHRQEEKIGFPDLSTHKTLAELADWYYVRHLGDTGKTPQQLEAVGQDDNYAWRGGARHSFQRWAEYEQLLRAIEAERGRLTEEERSKSSHPHRVVQVDAVTAAVKLDARRQELCLSLCEYREYNNGSGKGFRKGKAKEAELLQLQQQQEEQGQQQE